MDVMLFVTRNLNNEKQFEHLRTSVASATMTPDALKEELRTVSPTPAQLFRTIEVALLSASTLEVKEALLAGVREYVEETIKKTSEGGLPQSDTTRLVAAYRDASLLATFCQQHLSSMAAVSESSDGLTSADQRAYLLAQLQDKVRLTLKFKGLRVEDRMSYEDPAPQACGRSREDFLRGAGTINPDALNI